MSHEDKQEDAIYKLGVEVTPKTNLGTLILDFQLPEP
jgi:hypothetical protein